MTDLTKPLYFIISVLLLFICFGYSDLFSGLAITLITALALVVGMLVLPSCKNHFMLNTWHSILILFVFLNGSFILLTNPIINSLTYSYNYYSDFSKSFSDTVVFVDFYFLKFEIEGAVVSYVHKIRNVIWHLRNEEKLLFLFFSSLIFLNSTTILFFSKRYKNHKIDKNAHEYFTHALISAVAIGIILLITENLIPRWARFILSDLFTLIVAFVLAAVASKYFRISFFLNLLLPIVLFALVSFGFAMIDNAGFSRGGTLKFATIYGYFLIRLSNLNLSRFPYFFVGLGFCAILFLGFANIAERTLIHGDLIPQPIMIGLELLQSFEFQTLRSITLGMFVSNDIYLKELFLDGYNNPLKSLIPFTGETKGVGRQLTKIYQWRMFKSISGNYPLGLIGEAYILFSSYAPLFIYAFFCFFICFLVFFDTSKSLPSLFFGALVFSNIYGVIRYDLSNFLRKIEYFCVLLIATYVMFGFISLMILGFKHWRSL